MSKPARHRVSHAGVLVGECHGPKGRAQSGLERRRRGERLIDRVGQRTAVCLHELEGAARVGIGVGAAAGDEQRGRPWMPALELRLRDAGVVAVILDELVLQRGVMARIAEHDSEQCAVRLAHAQDRHRMVHRAIRRDLHAAVAGEACLAARKGQPRAVQRGRRAHDQIGQPLLEGCGVASDLAPLVGREVIGHRQLLVDHRSAVGVAGIEEEMRARNAGAPPNLARHRIGQPCGQPQQVRGDEHRGASVAILEREGLRLERQRRALCRLRAPCKAGHPQPGLGRDVDGGHARHA